MDNRALSTVVEKLLSLSIVLLYITLLTTVLYGGTVPAYRGAVGAELGERTLAESTARIEQTVPPAGRSVTASRRVSLPATIDGATYEIRAEGGRVVLDHPDPDIGGQARPVLPTRVETLTGAWQSGGEMIIRVSGTRGELTIRLEGSE